MTAFATSYSASGASRFIVVQRDRQSPRRYGECHICTLGNSGDSFLRTAYPILLSRPDSRSTRPISLPRDSRLRCTVPSYHLGLFPDRIDHLFQKEFRSPVSRHHNTDQSVSSSFHLSSLCFFSSPGSILCFSNQGPYGTSSAPSVLRDVP